MFDDLERRGKDPATVRRCSSTWRLPYRWDREAAASGEPVRVFTCSYSDFFHRDADAWRDEAWRTIRETRAVTYQILTKRPKRVAKCLPADWRDGYRNVWLGVSVESQDYAWRADILRDIPVAVRFISYEPALGPLRLDLSGFQWVIFGGESGPRHRPMRKAWARSMRDACRDAGVAFYFKQSAGRWPETGVELDGRTHREFPESSPPVRRVRQWGLFGEVRP
jgi:protein gp37